MSNKTKKKQQKTSAHGQTVCIFCGGTPLTEEHIFTDAIKKIVPRVGPTSFVENQYTRTLGEIGTGFRQKKRNGYMGNQRVKVVCGPCNNGWMNQIEEEALPIMTPLILGQPALLKRKQQIILAKWAILKAIIAEYTDIESKVVLAADRNELFANRSPIEGWMVWITRYNNLLHEGGGYSYQHTALTLEQAGQVIKEGNKEDIRPNELNAIFKIKNLFFYIFRSTVDSHKHSFDGYFNEKMIQIFPRIYREIDWDKLTPLESNEYEFFRSSLINKTGIRKSIGGFSF